MASFSTVTVKVTENLVKTNTNKEMLFKPLDKVRVVKPNDSRFGKVFTINRVNHYNGRYWLENELFSFAESDLELVLKHKW